VSTITWVGHVEPSASISDVPGFPGERDNRKQAHRASGSTNPSAIRNRAISARSVLRRHDLILDGLDKLLLKAVAASLDR